MFTTNSTLTENIFNKEKLAGYTYIAFIEASRERSLHNFTIYLEEFTPDGYIQWAPDYSELYVWVYLDGHYKGEPSAKLAITTIDNSVYLFEELDKAKCDEHRDTLNDAIVKLQNGINEFRRDRPFHTTNYRTPDPRRTEFYEKTKQYIKQKRKKRYGIFNHQHSQQHSHY